MNPRTLSALSLLNDLKHTAFEAMERRHKYPALLLLYSFIDICASVSDVKPPSKTNRTCFESYLKRYALLNWGKFLPYDLWAARSSLLHTYSPLGDHTKKPNGAKPIFYFAWPETEDELRDSLLSRGYSNFILLDIQAIKHIAISSFNAMWSHIENDAEFEANFQANSEHLLKDLFQNKLEQELTEMDELINLNQKSIDS